MAAINFPASPTTGQVFTQNGRSWIWNGTSWVANNPVTTGTASQLLANSGNGTLVNVTVTGPLTYAAGVLGASGAIGPSGATGPTGPVSTVSGPVGATGATGPAGSGGSTFSPVNNIAALKAVSKLVLQFVYVEGYYTSGDGGGGNYYYDSSDTTSADNGGTIIVANDGGRWKLSYQGALSVRQFGAMGNSSSYPDYTNQFKAAIAFIKSVNYTSAFIGGTLYVPQGQYRISDELLIDFTGLTIVGDGAGPTHIIQTVSNKNIFRFTGGRNRISNLQLNYFLSPAPTSGDAISINASNIEIDNVTIDVCFNGIHIYSSTAIPDVGVIYLTNIRINNIFNTGIFVEGSTVTSENVHDVCVNNVVAAGNNGPANSGLIRITEGANAVMFNNVDVTGGQYSLFIIGTTLKPNANYFNNCYFDAGYYGASISNAVQHQFTNCWFAGGYFANGYDGLTLSSTKGLRFVNCTWFQNGANGVRVASSTTFVGFIGCLFAENRSVGINSGNGIFFESGCNNFQVNDCTATNSVMGTGVQTYGIYISSSCNNFIITNNNLLGNGTSGLYNGSGTSATQIVSQNLG